MLTYLHWQPLILICYILVEIYLIMGKDIIIFLVSAVSSIIDALDDIYCLQESQPQERAHLLILLEDIRLHRLLEVSKDLDFFIVQLLAKISLQGSLKISDYIALILSISKIM